jgi:hypothetical protein
VVPPLSRQQVPGQGLAQRTHAAPPAARAMMIGAEHGALRPAASGPVPGAAFSLYTQFKTSNLLLE